MLSSSDTERELGGGGSRARLVRNWQVRKTCRPPSNVIYMRLLQNTAERKLDGTSQWKPPFGKGRHILGARPETGKPKRALPQRAPGTCKHGDSTVSDPRSSQPKAPASDIGWLQQAADLVSKYGSKCSTKKLAMNLGLALGNECSGKVQEALAVRADGTVSEPRAESP